VNLARFLKIDPEIALKRANGKFAARFHAMEAMARERGAELANVPRNEMERFWERAKKIGQPGDAAGSPGSTGILPAGLVGAEENAGKVPALRGKPGAGRVAKL
jgi:hypothetical protein